MDEDQAPDTDIRPDRRLPASRLRRRSEPTDQGPEPMRPQSLFAPRSVAGGRVQIYGCSPVFLLLSLLASLILTILLNVVFGFLS